MCRTNSRYPLYSGYLSILVIPQFKDVVLMLICDTVIVYINQRE